jgi:hypothetical protein
MSKVQIYGVYGIGDRIEIQSTLATRSANGATFKAEKGIPAFEYGTRIPSEDAHLTPDAALEAFITERTAKRDEHWRQIGILNGQCEQARSMIGAKS